MRRLFDGINLTDLAVVLTDTLLRLAISHITEIYALVLRYKPCFNVEIISGMGMCR